MKARLYSFLIVVLISMMSAYAQTNDEIIVFADASVKSLCVTNWDSDGDGELSYAEAQAVKSIGTVFSSNETITSFDELQYFSSISSLSMDAFYYCTHLKSIVLPASVKSIGKYAFSWCSNLQQIVLSDALESIASMAFYNCSSLSEIHLPAGLKSIGSEAFLNCKELVSVVIPSSVSSINGNCFASCYKLNSIQVESSNPYYSSDNGCNAVIVRKTNTLIIGCQSTVIPSTVVRIEEDAFTDCPLLTSIEIPNSVTSIGGWAFSGCTGLTDLKLSDSLQELGPYAFAYCTTLKTVEIPQSVTVIEEHAFDGCYGLKSVISRLTDVFATGSSAFLNCGNAKLYVQGDLIDQYQSTADWKRFKNIEAIPATIMLSCNGQGGVSMNGGDVMAATICELVAMDSAPNAFVFTPNEDCLLEEVIVDGVNMTNQVSDNTLNIVVHDGSKVIVSFRNAGVDMDVNHDGSVNISDVVTLVNFILEH